MALQTNRPVAVPTLAQAGMFIAAITTAIFFNVPWGIVAGMVILSAEAVWSTVCGQGSRRSVIVCWSSTLVVWVIMLLELYEFYPFEDCYIFVSAWLMVIGIWIAGHRMRDAARRMHWRIIGLTWGSLASCLWLFGTYMENKPFGFHLAVLGVLIVLIGCRLFFRLSGGAIQFVNTLILLLIGLPLVDAFLRPSYHLDTRPETGKHYYSFKVAKKDPTSFALWWKYFLQQMGALHNSITIRDPQQPWVFQPKSHGTFFQSEVSINRLGFRGPEIDFEKGDAYRIVVLGESTTFGFTIAAKDKPWPRLLERMLVNRLKPDRPVQVINAGVPAFSIWDNLRRMAR